MTVFRIGNDAIGWRFFKRALFILGACSCILAGPRETSGAYVLPSDRRITWSAGLDPVGGIPNDPSVICNGLDPTGATNNTSQINACISAAAARDAVYIPAGTYRVDGNIIMKSNVGLRGAGAGPPWLPNSSPGTTTLNMNGGQVLFDGGTKDTNWNPTRPNGTSITAGYAKNSISITLSDASSPVNYQVGDVISIYQDTDSSVIDYRGLDWLGEEAPSGDQHVKQQYSKITGKNGNTLTIDPPIYYVTPNPVNPKARKQTFGVSMAGLENLKLNGNGTNIKLIKFSFTRNCWVRNVETYNVGQSSSGSPHIWTDYSYGNEYRDSFHHHGVSRDSGRNYGIEFYNWNSAHKVENNIVRDTRHSIVFEGGGSGNAVLFNYTDDNGESVQGSGAVIDTSFLGEDAISNHGSHPYMNLWEGNSVTSWWADYTQGSSSHNTFFRNYVRGKNTTTPLDPNPWLWVSIEIEYYNRYYNFLGNVIGQASWTTGTVLWNQSGDPPQGPLIYRFGFSSAGGTWTDNLSYSTAVLHGNYDYITDGVAHWQGGSDQGLPNSFYYTAKPSWWCDETPWTPIGPDVTPLTSDIPAKRRYEGAACSAPPMPPPPRKPYPPSNVRVP
jgi:hypothetical protein